MKTGKVIPATRSELERFDLSETEMEHFLEKGVSLERAIHTTRESRLLIRLKKHYPCGRCLQPLGEKQGGFTWDIHTLTWVHVKCPRKAGFKIVKQD